MPTNSPGHEGRTDLYEKAKPAKQYWVEHPGMPDRPTGLHAYTVSDSPAGALENVRSEIAAKEGTPGLKDGYHILHLMSHDGTGVAKKEYSVSHNVEGGRTVPGSAGFIPTVGNAHHDKTFMAG